MLRRAVLVAGFAELAHFSSGDGMPVFSLTERGLDARIRSCPVVCSIAADYRLDRAVRSVVDGSFSEEEGPEEDLLMNVDAWDGFVGVEGEETAAAAFGSVLPRRYLYVVKVSRVVRPSPTGLPRLRMDPVPVQCMGEVSSLAQLLLRCTRAPSVSSYDVLSYVTCVGVDCTSGALADVVQSMEDAHVDLSERQCGRFSPCAFPSGVTVDAGHIVAYSCPDGMTDRVYVATMMCEPFSLPLDVCESVSRGEMSCIRGLLCLDQGSVAEYTESGGWFVEDARDRYVFYADSHPYQPFTNHYI